MKPSSRSELPKPVAVIDTQVWVSGLLNPRGAAAKVVSAFEDGLFTLTLSQAIFDEYDRVLSAFRPTIGDEAIDEVLATLIEAGTVVLPIDLPLLCRDITDNKFLECAVAAGAQFLVTKNVKHFPAQLAETRILCISEFLGALGR